jgi:hypothetical protein
VDDIDVTVNDIIQAPSYAGDLGIAAGADLAVSQDFTVYGAIEIDGSLNAGHIFLSGGSITATFLGSAPTPITCQSLDMTLGATLTVINTNVSIQQLTMAAGTTFLAAGVNFDGSISTAGTITFETMDTVTVTGNFFQTGGELIFPDLSFLVIEGAAPVSLAGRTIIEYGTSEITANKIDINGGGVLELQDSANLYIDGDLDNSSGTIELDTSNCSLGVSGNLEIFVGTVDAGGAGVTAFPLITAGGSVKLGPEDGIGDQS